MSVSERITLLFDSAKVLDECTEQDDTSLNFKNCNSTVIVQKRFTLPLDNARFDNIRFTWKPTQKSLGVIGPSLSSDANLYIGDVDTTLNLQQTPIITPLYKLYHSNDYSEIFTSLFSDLDTSFIHWDWLNNQYDITFSNSTVQINEYRFISNETTYSITKNIELVDKLEVGMFYPDLFEEENINLSGLRCLWNKDTIQIEKCIKTSLFYKSAFIPGETLFDNISIELETPVALHPKILLDLTTFKQHDECEYYLFSQLPLELFIDKFQSDPIFVFGEHNLELPDYKLYENGWGSESLFKLQPGELNEITLHSRYISPNNSTGKRIVHFTPQVFLACDTNSEEIEKNPFFSKGLGYEAFFTKNTAFYSLNSTKLSVPISYPDFKHYENIKSATLVCLVLSITYLLIKLFGVKTSKKVDDPKKNN